MGTIRSNKAEVPAKMKSHRIGEIYSSMFEFKNLVTLVSYVPVKNRSVTALPTMYHNTVVAGKNIKTEIILHYNATKIGVDNFDHLCTLYTCKRKVNRWPAEQKNAAFAHVKTTEKSDVFANLVIYMYARLTAYNK